MKLIHFQNDQYCCIAQRGAVVIALCVMVVGDWGNIWDVRQLEFQDGQLRSSTKLTDIMRSYPQAYHAWLQEATKLDSTYES